jgi:uncharacterized protein YndB with AHSA1/START domain
MIAVQKAVTVPRAPHDAFRLFVDDIARWWPLATHSVGREAATSVVFENGVGGRIVETYAGGRTAVWGTVTEWDPPTRVRFSWHPGTREEEATEVEVRFSAVAGGTEVELVHTGWDRRPDGPEARAGYEGGWEYVLGFFAAAAG